MTEVEFITKPPEQLLVVVSRVRRLRGLRGETLTACVRLEFNEKVIGESAKLEITNDAEPDFNFTSVITCNFDDPQYIDDIANKPLLLTVTEILPKEKKQKDEKTIALGQSTFDLYALVKGTAQTKLTAPIIPMEGSPLEQIPADNPKAEVDIAIRTASGKALFNEKTFEESNLVRIVVESMYNPPEAYLQTPSSCQILSYTAALPMAISGDKDSTVVFGTNEVKQPGTFERVQPKKWYGGAPGAHGAAQFIADSTINIEPYESETGHLREPESAELRRIAEQEKPILTWNTEKRAYLTANACAKLSQRITRHRILPVELFRVIQVHNQKTKKGKLPEEDAGISHHGVAYIDTSPLLFPGVKRIRGAFKVVPYMEAEYTEKTHRKTPVLEDAFRLVTQQVRSGSTKGKKEEKKPAAPEKEKSKKGEPATEPPSAANDAAAVATAVPGADAAAAVNLEGQQFADAGTYVIIEIEMHRALVAKRQLDQLTNEVAKYIPPRALFPKRVVGAEKAIDGYRSQVSQIADLVLEEFRRLFGKHVLDNSLEESADAMEQRRRELMYELTASGKYYAFKEQLKYCIIKIVREKFLKTGTFKDDAELQSFLSELYVFLIDEMHVSLNHYVSLEDKTSIPPSPVEPNQLKLFADEAERDGNYALANKYHEERISKTPKSPDNWFHYAVFAMGRHDVAKAEQCLKECLALDQKHLEGLMLYGIVCAQQNRSEEAGTFLEAATSIHPQSVTAWCTLSLFHEFAGNQILCDYALLEANRINKEILAAKAAAAAEAKAAAEPPPVVQPPPPLPPPVATPPATAAGSNSPGRRTRETTPKGKRRGTGTSTPRRSTTASSARSSNHELIDPTPPIPPVESRPASTAVHNDNTHQSIFIQTAEQLLNFNALMYAEGALAHESLLLAAENRESAIYQIALGTLHYKRKQYEKAVKFLDQAVRIEVQNANGWALLGHAEFEMKHYGIAQYHFERVNSLVTEARDMHSVHLRLAEIYLKKGMYEAAKTVFITACKLKPSARTWLGVGIACYRLNELIEAEDALTEANILNNSDPYAWAYLSLVCLRTNRALEAEQTYKYAIKTGLQDESLLSEIWQVQSEVGFGNPSF